MNGRIIHEDEHWDRFIGHGVDPIKTNILLLLLLLGFFFCELRYDWMQTIGLYYLLVVIIQGK